MTQKTYRTSITCYDTDSRWGSSETHYFTSWAEAELYCDNKSDSDYSYWVDYMVVDRNVIESKKEFNLAILPKHQKEFINAITSSLQNNQNGRYTNL